MAATKSSDSNPLKACSLDRTHDGVLLLQGRDSVLVPGTNVNWRIKKVCAWPQFRISVTQVVFIRAGHVNSDDATTVSCKKRRDITNAFASTREPCAGHRPLLRPGKAPVKRVDGSDCHGLAPCHIVVLRVLWAVPRQQHPALSKSDPSIEIGQIIPVLTFKIACGTSHQNRPDFCWIKICGRGQHCDCVCRDRIAALPSI